MTLKNTQCKFKTKSTIITYDLYENDVSASEISSNSNNLFVTLKIGNKEYNLPNTTLYCELETTKKAIDEFRSAFSKTGSKSEIKRLFVVEVFEKNS